MGNPETISNEEERALSNQGGKDGTDEKTQHAGRKKRLSRKEQKARKKKQKRQKLVDSNENGKQSAETNVLPQPQETTAAIKTKPIPLEEDEEEACLANYVPVPIPKHDEHSNDKKKKSLGKWFPKATVIKSKTATTANDKQESCLVLFYQYVTPPWPESRVQLLIKFLEKIATTRTALGGRIRVAPEGVNATLSALSENSKRTLQHFCQDLKNFDSVFEETDFKFIPNLKADRHFKDFKILPVKELVFYGISHQDAPLTNGGVHLEPTEFHKMLGSKKDTVVIDVRNHYEAAIGRFDGQAAEEGAEYVDPRMRKSTDFTSWLEQPDTQRKLENKKVMMFCTGGVRCERASAYLNQKMGSSVKGIYQLKGGIERYLQTYEDGGYWKGKNYVFDKREAISAENRNGDGGVLRREQQQANVETECCVCHKPWDRYVGKKKCDTCGVPVLMCDTCIMTSKQKKKKTGKESSGDGEKKSQLVRCPLCVEQGITVRASEVEYTNNGVANKVEAALEEEKAAPSVLKWGGGHASQKKEKRRMKRKLCRFGAECVRKDCFFAHPEREEKNKS